MVSKILALMLFACVAFADIHDTQLGILSGSLASGEYAELPSPTLVALPLSKLGYAQLYWNDSGKWDGQRISQINGPGTCCGNPPTFRNLSYDTVSDVWSITDTSYTGAGHAYDGNAYDPTSNTHFWARPQTRIMASVDQITWWELPPVPFSDQVISASLTWFPEANGGLGALLYFGRTAQIAAYYSGEWHVISCPTCNWGSYNSFSQHGSGIVWFGGMLKNWKMNPDFSIVALPNSPFETGNNKTYISHDSFSGHFIVTRISDRTWWTVTAAGASVWTQKTEMTNNPMMPFNYSGFHVPIPELGVIVYVRQYYGLRGAWVWRVSEGYVPPPDPGPCIPAEYDTDPPLAFCPAE